MEFRKGRRDKDNSKYIVGLKNSEMEERKRQRETETLIGEFTSGT